MKSHPVTTTKLSESELDDIRTLIEQRSAILFDASRERFFSTRIREYIEEKEIASGVQLCEQVKSSSTEYEALLERLLTQVARILALNGLETVTREVVEAARKVLVIGTT